MNKIALFILMIFLITGCRPEKKGESQKPVISVSILPQKYFLEQLSGSLFRINVMVPPGASPATYELTPGQMISLSESILYFQIGHIGFEEAWMERIASTNKKMKIYDTSEGIELISGAEDEHGDHVHLHGIDPHVWMSVTETKKICENMHKALTDNYPVHKELFDTNYEKWKNILDELHK